MVEVPLKLLILFIYVAVLFIFSFKCTVFLLFKKHLILFVSLSCITLAFLSLIFGQENKSLNYCHSFSLNSEF